MDIWDFPVKYAWGNNVPGYDGFHTGEDRPTGGKDNIPVTVNGVTIGIAGTSGESTGIHLHTDRYVNGVSTNPHGGGKTVAGARVTAVAYDTRNGHYVHVQDADGSRWGYRHLKPGSIKVAVGDILKQGEEVPMPNDEQIRNALRIAYKNPSYQPTGEEFRRYKQTDWGWPKLLEDVAASLRPSDEDITKALRQAKNDPSYKPTADELARYKKLDWGWAKLLSDTLGLVGDSDFVPYSGPPLFVENK